KTPSGTATIAASAKNVSPFSTVTFTPFMEEPEDLLKRSEASAARKRYCGQV
ncbi:hypothetical protein Tco_0696442, partial [Tanacetum coccineum]